MSTGARRTVSGRWSPPSALFLRPAKNEVLVRADLIDHGPMAKAPRRFRGVDLEARRRAFGAIYVWLYRRHDQILRDHLAKTPGLWAVTAGKMDRDGVLSMDGRSPSRAAVREAWQNVALHYPADSQRYEVARQANAGHVSRRHKGWVPTSTAPLAPPRPAVSPPSRAVLPATEQPQQSRRSAPLPSADVPHPMTVSRNYLTGDDPLANVTPDEAAALAVYVGADRGFLLSMLRTIRKVAHLDRHNIPPK